MDPKVIILVQALTDLAIRFAFLAKQFEKISQMSEEEVDAAIAKSEAKSEELLKEL